MMVQVTNLLAKIFMISPIDRGDSEEKKMYKVVYFDEYSAGDYLNISNKGVTKENTEKSTTKQKLRKFGIKTEVKLGLSAATIAAIVTELAFNNFISHLILGIFGGITAIANVTPITFDFSSQRNREDKELVSTQVTSTILSQFLVKQKMEKDQILCIQPEKVHIEEGSFSFIKFYEPMFKIIKSINSEDIDISKFGDALKETKGYYELKATIKKDQSEEEIYCILRLNAESFRNNYKLTDLLHMNITYYGIKVGKMSMDEMNILHALNINKNISSTPQQTFARLEPEKNAIGQESEDNKYDIIDIILAGVGEDGKN